MKRLFSFLRITGLVVLAIILTEITLDTGDQWAFEKYPVLWLILAVILVLAIAIEASVASLEKILFRSLSPEAQQRYLNHTAEKRAARFAWLSQTYERLLDKKPIEKEDEIILDHNYDGIRELDNSLPPWWLYGFYASMIFAFIYLVNYHLLGGDTQKEEYVQEITQAQEAIEAYKKTAKGLVDENTVELLTGEDDVKAGQAIFTANCVACHKADAGGGIGPNLTDDYWILGGGIKNVFHTISEGGRPGKGMISWKTDLKPDEIAQVASYVLSLHGTQPAEPKEPQGELWIDPNAPVDEVSVKKQGDDMEIIMENTSEE
ncbi:MAG: cbb3-type cytochrome c oxidase N-terminal domain-containing protein [Bacteroidota bacterium]|nr:cbb3-type cytochrome c oxidase N-terminal domain-containing protein [Bacteroidota bacterium]